MCNSHRRWLESHGSLDGYETRVTRSKTRESGTITEDGYVRVRIDGKRVKEHRYIMEQMLGRPLLPHENVHHINGVKNDNRPENLELWSSSQPPGQRVVDKLAWAYEIIKLYG